MPNQHAYDSFHCFFLLLLFWKFHACRRFYITNSLFFCKAQCHSKQRYDNDNNSRYNSSRRVFRLVCQQTHSGRACVWYQSNTAVRRLRVRKHCNHKAKCFQAVRTKLSHKSNKQPHKPESHLKKNERSTGYPYLTLTLCVQEESSFPFHYFCFLLHISINGSSFFYLFCKTVVIS